MNEHIYNLQIEAKREIKKDIIGKYIQCSNGEIFIVEDYAFQKNDEHYYQIRFLKDGYRNFASYKNVKRGYSSNPYICDGTMGTSWGEVDMTYPNIDKIKLRYDDMFDRIFNPKNKGYHGYGGSGVRIDPTWFCFENYVRDITSQRGFHPALLCKENFIQLDKDYLQTNIENKYDLVYSKYTTMWLLAGFNSGFTKRETYKYSFHCNEDKIYYALDIIELENIISNISQKALEKFLKEKKSIIKKKKGQEIKIGNYKIRVIK